jgi:hypothetical protein
MFSAGKMFDIVCSVVKVAFFIYVLFWLHDKEIHRKIIRRTLAVKLFVDTFGDV